MSARQYASAAPDPKRMRRFQYEDPDLAKKLEGEDMSDYAIHCEDTYLCHNLFDMILLRAVEERDRTFDPWTHLQSISRSVEMRLKNLDHKNRYHALLNSMYTAAGRQGLSGFLWAHYGVVQGGLRPYDPNPLCPGSMVAYLVMSAPAAGVQVVQVVRPLQPKVVHTLRPGDVLLCKADDLEIVGDGRGAEICYMLTPHDCEDEAPAKVLCEPIFSAQLLVTCGFLEAMCQARQAHPAVIKPAAEITSYAAVESCVKSEISSPPVTPSYLDIAEPAFGYDPAGFRPATPPLDPNLIFDASSGRFFPAPSTQPSSTPYPLHSLPAKPAGSTPYPLHSLPAKPAGSVLAVKEVYEMAPHVLVPSRRRR